jgi:hypothetical protein
MFPFGLYRPTTPPPPATNPSDPRTFKVKTAAPQAAVKSDYDFKSPEVLEKLKQLDNRRDHYRDGVSFAELKPLDKAAGEDHQLSVAEAQKAGLFQVATPEALADLDVINQYLSRCHSMDPNQIAFPARLKGTAKQTEVTGYQTERLKESEIIAQFQEIDAKVLDKENPYTANGTGCEAITNALHSAILGKEINASVIPSDYREDLKGQKVQGVKDTPFDRAHFLKLIQDGKLRPGMMILINSDPALKLAGDSGNQPTINASGKNSDRHWFTYMGLSQAGEPILLDNLSRQRPLSNMLENFPTHIPQDYTKKYRDKRQAWERQVETATGKKPSKAEITSFDKEFKRAYTEAFRAEHGRAPKHNETMIFDHPGGQMSIHSIIDFYDDTAPDNAFNSRKRFERIAQGVAETIPGKELPLTRR